MLGFSFRARHIGDYMKRWILTTPWGTLRLHKICRSDADRHLHDHPWDFTSIVLSGGYTELTPSLQPGVLAARYFGRGSVNRKTAEDLHRLVLTEPTWTLVFTGPRRRRWGFMTERGWVHWKEYTETTSDEAED